MTQAPSPPSTSSPALFMRFYGSDFRAEDMRRAQEHMASLLREVDVAMHGRVTTRWKIGPARRECDGCGMVAPSLDLPSGWVNGRGRDYCPSCLEGGGR